MQTVKEKQKESFKALKETRGYENPMEVPTIEKVVLSSGIGSISDTEKIEVVRDRLAKIAGQQPVPASAKKSIASFDVRAGDVTGYKVTLRGAQALNFIDKMIHVVLPRTKDFRGISRGSVDEMGNLTIGIDEHTVFPATSDEELKNVFGLSVTIVTSADTADEAVEYFEHIGVPFQKQDQE